MLKELARFALTLEIPHAVLSTNLATLPQEHVKIFLVTLQMLILTQHVSAQKLFVFPTVLLQLQEHVKSVMQIPVLLVTLRQRDIVAILFLALVCAKLLRLG